VPGKLPNAVRMALGLPLERVQIDPRRTWKMAALASTEIDPSDLEGGGK